MNNTEVSWLEVADGIPDARRLVEEVFDLHLRARKMRLGGAMCVSALIVGLSAWALHSLEGAARGAVFVAQILASGVLGSLLGRIVRPRLDPNDLFHITPGSAPFWTALQPKYGRRSFNRLLDTHGPGSFEVRDIAHLERVLSNVEDSAIGMWGAHAIRNERLYKLRLKQWVDAHSGGSAEMARHLSAGAPVGTLDELVQLVNRLGRRASE